MHFDSEAFFRQFLYDPSNPLLFNNGFFVFFFTAFILLYHLLRTHTSLRTYTFCLFSLYFFYKASGSFVLLVIFSSLFNYLLSKAIHKTTSLIRKNIYMVTGTLLNLGILFYYKYTNFFIGLLNEATDASMNPLNILLPVGISFYTFENISYMTDVRRGTITPVNKFSEYLLFLSFFPKLVMGPIVRAKDFIPQIGKPWNPTHNDFHMGLKLILGGLCKKLIISDYLTIHFVDYVFDDPARFTSIENLMAVYAYAIVIYCDFSGYSDIAIGIARWLGFNIPGNFQSPYKSLSITDFWRRWHISLSSWLRDYLYIPMGGNRNATVPTFFFTIFFITFIYFLGVRTLSITSLTSIFFTFAVILIMLIPSIAGSKSTESISANLNLTATMLLGGLWHGANWNFILWGGMHGLGLCIHKAWMHVTKNDKYDSKGNILLKAASGLLTFHFVCLGWIFFKSAEMHSAISMIQRICSGITSEMCIGFISSYRYVFAMMVTGYLMHLLNISNIIPASVEMRGLPLWVYLFIALAFVFLYDAFKSAQAVKPIYLQF
jgi:alginate O-acetyltransferase complex protein AlgI